MTRQFSMQENLARILQVSFGSIRIFRAKAGARNHSGKAAGGSRCAEQKPVCHAHWRWLPAIGPLPAGDIRALQGM